MSFGFFDVTLRGMSNNMSGTFGLVIVNALVFVVTQSFPSSYFYFAVNYDRVVNHWEVWRIVTYMFFHAGFLHIFFNMLILYWLGSELENYWGRSLFLQFYFFSGIISALFILLGDFLTHLVSGYYGYSIGASGAISACFLAYGLYYPERIVLFFFVIPMKIRTLVIFSLFFSLFAFAMQLISLSLDYGASRISDIGHFGGFVAAVILVKLYKRRKYEFSVANTALNEEFHRFFSKLGLKDKTKWSTKQTSWGIGVFGKKKTHSLDETKMTRVEVERQIDELLDKISKKGIRKLTDEEQQFLDRVSKDFDYKFPK